MKHLLILALIISSMISSLEARTRVIERTYYENGQPVRVVEKRYRGGWWPRREYRRAYYPETDIYGDDYYGDGYGPGAYYDPELDEWFYDDYYYGRRGVVGTTIQSAGDVAESAAVAAGNIISSILP